MEYQSRQKTDGTRPNSGILMQDRFWWTLILAGFAILCLVVGFTGWLIGQGLQGMGPFAEVSVLLTPAPTENPNSAQAETKAITIVMDATYPPFEYIDENTTEIVGFDVDLIRDIAKREGLEIKIINVSWDTLLTSVNTCKYDAAISAIIVTPEREKTILFSDPYFTFGQVVVVRKSESQISGKDDLTGGIVGVQLGTISQTEAEKIPGIKVQTYDDTNLMFQDLMNNEIDAIIIDNIIAFAYTNQNPDVKVAGRVFAEEHVAIAICKNRPDLLEVINHGLAEARAEGVLDDLNQKWFKGKTP